MEKDIPVASMDVETTAAINLEYRIDRKKGKQNNSYLFLYTDLRNKNKKSRLDKKEAELYNHNRSK